MSPDDPRHGEVNTYKTLRCRCQPCSAAAARYEKRRKWLVHQGMNPTVPAIGFVRRVHALMAIGWTQRSVAEALGIAPGNLALKLRTNGTVYRATHVAMCEIYEARCMSPQRGHINDRIARIATKNGWAPPLAWDDIDDPDEQPNLGGNSVDHIDHVIVDRLLAGERIVSSSAEKVEAMRRWLAAGGSERALCKVHGWKDGRYVERPDEVA